MNDEPKVDARRGQSQRFVINDERLKMNDDEDFCLTRNPCELTRRHPSTPFG